jgi:hypothetical protein
MENPKVHVIKHHSDHGHCYSVYDEATGVLVSKLTERIAKRIAATISDEVVVHDATTSAPASPPGSRTLPLG